jgi:hypothetical protein
MKHEHYCRRSTVGRLCFHSDRVLLLLCTLRRKHDACIDTNGNRNTSHRLRAQHVPSRRKVLYLTVTYLKGTERNNKTSAAVPTR